MNKILTKEFNEAWNELNELYNLNEEKLYEVNAFTGKPAPSEKSLFKFLANTRDLISVIQSNVLWSNLNTDGLQHDSYCDELKAQTGKEWTYISFTSEPTKVALELNRPFGIEFEKNKLSDLVNQLGFKLRPYNQFLDKTSSIPQRLNDTKLLRLGNVGKTKDGKYFFTLQGNYSMRFVDEVTYNKLLDWLKNNSEDQLVHFVNNVENPIASKKDKTKNNKYVYDYTIDDFIDYKNSTITVSYSNGRKNLSNKNFLTTAPGGIGFTQNFRNIAEVWATVVNREIGLNAFTRYNEHAYNTKVKPLVDPNLKAEYALDPSTFNSIAMTLNEYEYRVYLPRQTSLRVNPSLIKKIKLPNYYDFSLSTEGPAHRRTVPLENIFNDFKKFNTTNEEDMINICNKNAVLSETENAAIIDLYKQLHSHNLSYSFFNYSTPIVMKTKLGLKDFKTDKYKDDINDLYDKVIIQKSTDKNLDLTRYTSNKADLHDIFSAKAGDINNINDNTYEVIKLTDNKGCPSLIYKNFAPHGNRNKMAPARLEVRGIILGRDENNTWYINVIEKGSSFNELPGGSFDTLPRNENDLINIAKDKFGLETGKNLSGENIELLNIITYMYEPQADYMKKIHFNWPYCADWMFVCILKDIIDPAEINQTSDGRSKWITVDFALSNNAFAKRYINLKSIIKSYIK